MIIALREWSEKKDRFFAQVIGAHGEGGRMIRTIGLSLRSFPETAARADDCLARAKKQPRTRLTRALKRALIAAQYNWSRRYFAGHPDYVALLWNGLTGSRRAYALGARDGGAQTLFAELAPFAGMMTLDPAGVNAAGSLPRDPAFYRDWAAARGGDPGQWRAHGDNLTARPSRNAGVAQRRAGADAFDAPFLFVPLQVPNDTQVTLMSGWAGSIDGLLSALERAAAALPEGWQIRIKEHPSSRISYTAALTEITARCPAIVIDNETDTFDLVAASAGVVTINSSVGLQAFFFDKPVMVLGEALYAIPGVVAAIDGPEALAAALAAPGEIGFDPALRDVFMRHLTEHYYIEVPQSGPLAPSEAAKVAALLAR